MRGSCRSGLSETFAICIRYIDGRPRRACGSKIHDGAHVVIINNVTGDVTVIQFWSYESVTLSGAGRLRIMHRSRHD